METTKQKLIRYTVSTLLTFFVGFLSAFLAGLLGVIDTGESLNSAMFFSLASGALISATRLVIKALIEKLQTMQIPQAFMLGKKK